MSGPTCDRRTTKQAVKLSRKRLLSAVRPGKLTHSEGIAMNMRLLVAAANIGVVFLLGSGIAAQAAEVRVLSSYAMREVMIDVMPKFAHATGHKFAIKIERPRLMEELIHDGETADVVIASGDLVAKGKIVPGSAIPVARGFLGVAVRKGAPSPDISTPDAVKRALLAAKSISYNFDGASFVHLTKVLERWGITDEMKRKTILGATPPRRVGTLVANGEAEIGLHAIALLIGIPGIDIIGSLPDDLQTDSVGEWAAIMAGAKDVAAAKALIDFLRTPATVAVIKAKGMAPAAQMTALGAAGMTDASETFAKWSGDFQRTPEAFQRTPEAEAVIKAKGMAPAAQLTALGAAGMADASETLAKSSGCMACHAVHKKMLGPSYKAVADKYRSDKNAETSLVKKVKSGSQGVWGAVPMPPSPHVKDEEIKTLVRWVLLQQ